MPNTAFAKHSFLQSHEWEKLQEILGRKSWRVDGHLIIMHDLPGGFNYLYSPRPPELADGFLRKVREIALKEKSIFLKIDPQESVEHHGISTKNWKFSHFLQPRKTVVIDLTKSDESIFSAMHPKTRYNIRLAERHGVHVFKCDHTHIRDLVDTFWRMLAETARRDIFHTHPRHYYQKLVAIRGVKFSNNLFFAEYRGEMLAAAIVNYYERRATYLHGASSNVHRNIMASYLLHWRAMQDAKKNGMTVYDFWGIDEERWPGVTRFKLGFGGKIVDYPQSIDIIFRPAWYRAYRAARRVL